MLVLIKKRLAFLRIYVFMEPRSGLEPETYALPWRRSTN